MFCLIIKIVAIIERSFNLIKLGIDLKVFDNNEEELNINIFGYAEDEIQLIIKAITTLIFQIDLNYMCNEDLDTFNKEMKKILFAIVDNYGRNGLYDSLTQNENSKEKLAKTLLNYLITIT
ncbi:hypothetical protein C0966_17530 (plasmid) [Bacillus methanolicus]|nr:hypothetical protein [Bacillus methanolicus]